MRENTVLIMLAAALVPAVAVHATPESTAALAVSREYGVSTHKLETRSVTPTAWDPAHLPCGPRESNNVRLATRGHRVVLRAEDTTYIVYLTREKIACMRTFRATTTPAASNALKQANAEPDDAPSRALISSSRLDLATRLGATVDAISFVSFEIMRWPDGSFGCPRPGMVYPQVPRDGVRITFEISGQRYAYHGGEGRAPFLCENHG